MAKKKTKRVKLQDVPNVATDDYFAPTSRPDYSLVNPNTGRIPEAQTPFPAAAGSQASSPTGTDLPVSTPLNSDSKGFQSGAKISMLAKGNSGTQIFGGYFSEEYLNSLRGREGAKKWDEMRRSESQIAMLLNAVFNPIKAATWDIQPYDSADPNCVLHAEFLKFCLFEQIDFDTFKHEALTFVPFGFSLFEVVHNVMLSHPKFGTRNGLAAIAFRSQKTIENWILQPKTGKLQGVNQYTYSDLGGNEFIPGEFLLVITHSKEGDNYEGISALRPMLGPYVRKELYLKLAAIGVERYAIGTPVGTVPIGKEKTAEYDEFLAVLQNYTSHESSYIVVPQGWTIEIQKGEFDAGAIKELITLENTEFANAMVANFLALGMNGSSSSLALGSNLLEFFTSGIQAYADTICATFNRDLSPNLVKVNYGEQRGYPKMKVTGITDKAGKDLAEALKFLVDARLVDPDKPLKEHLRKLFDMPKPDENTAVAMPAIPAGAAANYPKPNDPVVNPKTGKIEPYNPSQLTDQSAVSTPTLHDRVKTIQLAEKKYVARFDRNKAALKSVMSSQLAANYEAMKDLLRKKFKAASPSERILVAKGVDMPGLNLYRSAIRDALSDVAEQSLSWARSQVPAKKNVKLSDYDALPPKVRRLVDAQSSIIADTQTQDLEKIVYFQFTSSAATDDDIDAILNDVDGKVLPTLDGSTGSGMSMDAAAGDAIAQVTQQSAMSFFQDDDVEDAIESYTFTNEDPVSECCQELAGTTFSVDDPDLDTYQPPLHHNCKSRMVPNLKGDNSNPDIDRGGIAITQKALDAITLGEDRSMYRIRELS